ncbi:hypothetical protein Scep_028852 [Stephania cephalantha]|uniref:EH domain-containing protein 1 n=1 Tax=Stephania cephalantha TaxID=152367 RepID=A0AAP0EAR0_9MAGN
MEIASGPISLCSKEHQKIYQDWFNCADLGFIFDFDFTISIHSLSDLDVKLTLLCVLDFCADGDGRITGNDAIKFFAMSNLSRPELKQIPKGKGFLGLKEFIAAMQIPLSSVTSIVDGLKRLYLEKLKPLEVTYRFNDFASPLLTNSDFDAKPMVMLLGQYSTGKTTFIKHLLRSSYPEHITFVDTPGVLSGEKQRTQRSYDFTGVTSWFAAKCDLILLLFDPHKLDISDEFKRVIGSLRGHDDKIRVVLNKADQVDTQQKELFTMINVDILGFNSSFNDKPVNEAAIGPIGKELFEKEQDDLLSDLKDIPKKACDRRINEFVKRARAAKIHSYIISHLKKEMPAMMGKSKVQQRLIDNLEDEFAKVRRDHHLPPGDFPNVEHFREVLGGYNIDKFEKLKPKLIQAVDDMLGYDIPDLLKNFRNPYE